MPDGPYDRNVLLWSERQADLLRWLVAGERVNEQVDWVAVVEEMEDVGRSELNGCSGNLLRAMQHLLELMLLANSLDVPHWNSELAAFLGNAADHYTLPMDQCIDLDKLYQRALGGQERGGAAEYRLAALMLAGCPFALAGLVVVKPDIDAMLLRLASPLPA